MFRKLLDKLQGLPQPSGQVCNRCSTVYKVLNHLKIKISDNEIYRLHRIGALCPEVCGTSFPTVFLRDNFDALPIANENDCTATGNSGHSLRQDYGIISIYLKGISDGETKTKKLHLRV